MDPQACLANGCAAILNNVITPHDRLRVGADAIRDRLRELDAVDQSYLQYLHMRIKERDWHGAWDACVNLSEVSCERDGLTRALEALGEA